MEKIKYFIIKNFKLIIISIVLILFLIIGIVLTKSNDNRNNIVQNDVYQIVLFGKNKIELKEGEIYQEPGYYATLNGKLITEDVEVINLVNVNKSGIYEITYKVGDILEKRTIKVIAKQKEDILTLTLTGDQEVNLYTGETYIDKGAKATYNGKDISGNIEIENDVNTSVPGTYNVSYRIKFNNITKEVFRKVIVLKSLKNNLSLKLNVNLTNLTNKNVTISTQVEGDNFSYLKYPNGTVTRSTIGSYDVNQNGTYKFYAYDINGNYKVESITVNNIDKIMPTGVCKAVTSYNKTEITVNAYDINGISKYIYNSKYQSTNPNYVIPSKMTNVYVDLYDQAGNKKTINCEIQNKSTNLEIHFIAGVSDDDIILIRTEEKTIMIDGGQYDGRNKVVNYLKDLGVKKIDAMIGSHVHWNHVQAQGAILQNFEVDKLYYSVDILNCVSKKQCKSDDVKYIKNEIIKQKKTPTVLSAGSYLKIGDMELYFIGPTRGILTTYQNANSLVFILKHGNKKYMFTGDTPGKYMDTSKFNTNISKFNMNLDVDVLKFPHHGYEDLSDDLFKATTPKYVIIPNCCSCSSKYPSSKNKSLLKKYNTKYYQVCDSKNTVILSDGDNITIKTKQSAVSYKR